MIPPISCRRAAAVFHGLESGKLEVTADEIEQLLKMGLAVEAEPAHLIALQRMSALREEFAEHFHEADPLDVGAFQSALTDIDHKLKSEWYRLRTSRERIREHEKSRVELRRALGMLHDEKAMPALRRILADGPLLPSGAKYFPCPKLGVEHYTITVKGVSLHREILLRIARVGEAPLGAFVKSFEKAHTKMKAFSDQIRFLKENVGPVRKNPEQVVIGLAKTGMAPQQALHTYRSALASSRAADVAVTLTRNAAASGGPGLVQHRLQVAVAALVTAGFPHSPVVAGAAKTLLPFSSLDVGVARFVELYKRLRALYGNGDHLYKFIVRLMPAAGSPAEAMARVKVASHALHGTPSRVTARSDNATLAVAIASMVKDEQAVAGAVARHRALEAELVQHQVSDASTAERHALECLACPGTPAEVASVVRSLSLQIESRLPPSPANAAIAVAFAKRFAY